MLEGLMRMKDIFQINNRTGQKARLFYRTLNSCYPLIGTNL